MRYSPGSSSNPHRRTELCEMLFQRCGVVVKLELAWHHTVESVPAGSTLHAVSVSVARRISLGNVVFDKKFAVDGIKVGADKG